MAFDKIGYYRDHYTSFTLRFNNIKDEAVIKFLKENGAAGVRKLVEEELERRGK